MVKSIPEHSENAAKCKFRNDDKEVTDRFSCLKLYRPHIHTGKMNGAASISVHGNELPVALKC